MARARARARRAHHAVHPLRGGARAGARDPRASARHPRHVPRRLPVRERPWRARRAARPAAGRRGSRARGDGRIVGLLRIRRDVQLRIPGGRDADPRPQAREHRGDGCRRRDHGQPRLPHAPPRRDRRATRHDTRASPRRGAMGIAVAGSVSQRRGRATGVGVMALAHLTNDSYAYMLPALLPVLLTRLDITVGLAGILVTLYQASSSFTQPFFGHLADRGSATRWMAWTGVALSGLAAGALGLAPSFAVLALALLAGGLGTALYHPVSAALVASAVPGTSRGRWMSVYISAGNFGLPIGPLVLGLLLASIGLGGTWLVALPALAVAALVWRLGPRIAARRDAAPVSLRAVLRRERRMLAGLVAVSATRSWASSLVTSFLPLYGSFVVLAVRGQESMPGNLGMVSGLMLGLSIGLGGLAVAPMAAVAERAGLEVVLYAAGALSLLCAAVMSRVPKPPHIATV